MTTSFPTQDTTLAAYLYSRGANLLGVDKTDYPYTFKFEDSPEIRLIITRYQQGEAPGNIIAYHRAYKTLLRQIKGEG